MATNARFWPDPADPECSPWRGLSRVLRT